MSTRVEKRRRVLPPAGLVEIDGQEEARLVLKQRIDPCDKRLPHVVTAGQVPANDLIGDGQEASMEALGALDARLLADTAHPLVGARGGVAGLAGLAVFESTGVDVVAAAEERPEESDLRRGR